MSLYDPESQKGSTRSPLAFEERQDGPALLREDAAREQRTPSSPLVETTSSTMPPMFSTILNFVKNDPDIADDISSQQDDLALQDIINRGRKQSYEDIAATLASTTPQLWFREGKSTIFVKVLYSGGPSETKTMSLRALLVDILNVAQNYDHPTHLNSLHAPSPQLKKRQQDRATSPSSAVHRHSSTMNMITSETTNIATNNSKHSSNLISAAVLDRREIIPELRQRDLRRLESGSSTLHEDPYVVIRRHAVLVSLGPLISAVVQAERVILIAKQQEAGSEDTLNQLERHINEWIRTPQMDLHPAINTAISSCAADSHPQHAASHASMLTSFTPFVTAVAHTTTKVVAETTRHFSITGAPPHASTSSTAHSETNNATNSHNRDVITIRASQSDTNLVDHVTPTKDRNTCGVNNTGEGLQRATSAAAVLSANPVHLPFELRVYEALFSVMHTLLQRDLDGYNDNLSVLHQAIGAHSLLSLQIQEALRALKGQIGSLRARAEGCTRLLLSMSMDDRDSGSDIYAFLNLQELRHDPSIYDRPMREGVKILYSRYSDLEVLLDAHLTDFQSMESQIHALSRRLDDVEQMVSLRLDISRNELLVASTVMSVFACTIGFSGFITGAFGMNLDNSTEFTPVRGLFYVVFGTCVGIIVIVTWAILHYFRAKGILPTHAKS